MSDLKEISGFYGSGNTPCTVFIYELQDGSSWYCVEDSKNVNLTWDYLENGIDVETVNDVDTFTSGHNIETLDQLESVIDEDEEEEGIPEFCDLTIIIDEFGNQTMIDDPEGEVIRILEVVIKRIKSTGLSGCGDMNLRDINGNTIGRVDVTEN